MSLSFFDTTKFEEAYGLYLSMLSYEMYFSKNTNFVVVAVSGSTIILKISGLSTTPSSSSSKKQLNNEICFVILIQKYNLKIYMLPCKYFRRL